MRDSDRLIVGEYSLVGLAVQNTGQGKLIPGFPELGEPQT